MTSTLKEGFIMTYVLLNDSLIDRKNAKVDITDRGYQFGDGLYEVIRIYQEKPFTLKEHLERFLRSANELSIQLPYPLEELEAKILLLLEKNKIIDGTIYLQLTRGVTPRNHIFPETSAAPQLVAYTNHVKRPLENLENGVSAMILEDIRWLRCDIKSLNLLGSVLSKQKAYENGCYEAILHREGNVTEGSSSNIFMVKNNILYTHPANHLILNGITRLEVLNICKENNIPHEEKVFTIDELLLADEVFLTSTTSEITPIVKIDNSPIKNGTVGDLTKKLQLLFEKRF